ncbi:MAG: hypothetical protein LUH43_00605 [Clostridia bacterium]|nr:hypothetical protein [Clostridia bacterium]
MPTDIPEKNDDKTPKKPFLAAALLFAFAVAVIVFVYLPLSIYSNEVKNELNLSIDEYIDTMADKLSDAALYEKIAEEMQSEGADEVYCGLTAEILEEDVIMYSVELEERLGEYISHGDSIAFSDAETLTELSDGSVLYGVSLLLAFEAPTEKLDFILSGVHSDTYKVLISDVNLEYDADNDTVSGNIAVMLCFLKYDGSD